MGSYATAIEVLRRINHCGDKHSACDNLSMRYLPSRGISVVSLHEAQQARLHIAERRKRGHYVALSYCWGPPGSQTLMTRMDNIDKNTHHLNLEALSKTIQDAIAFTRKLGIRYLWVDALCIIQDSPADKESAIDSVGQITEMLL